MQNFGKNRIFMRKMRLTLFVGTWYNGPGKISSDDHAVIEKGSR